MENLNVEQKKILLVILNMIIPRSEDGKMPGAIDVGFLHLSIRKVLLD